MASSSDHSRSGSMSSVSSAGKNSLRRMLDLEKTTKVERTEYAPHRVLPVPASAVPRPPRIQKGPIPAPIITPLQSQPMKRSATAPFVPTLSALSQEVDLPQTPPPDVQETRIADDPPRATTQLPFRMDMSGHGNEEGNDSDRSSICQSPGWDNAAKAKKKKQEAKEKKKQAKVQAEKDAKQAKRGQKRLSKPPPTNKIFDRMGAAAMERSASAPMLDKVTEDKSKETPSRPGSSRRGSLEAGIRSLKNLAGPWKHDSQSHAPENQPAPASGFVGGLKLKREQEVALQESFQTYTFPVPGQVHNFSHETPAHSRSVSEAQHPALRDPEDYLRSGLPKQSAHLRHVYDESARRASTATESGSYALSSSRDDKTEAWEDEGPIMERNIRRPHKSRGSVASTSSQSIRGSIPIGMAAPVVHTERASSPAGESQNPVRTHKTSLSVVYPFTRSVTDPVSSTSQNIASSEQYRGRVDNSTQSQQAQSRGRSVTAPLQQARRASDYTPQATVSRMADQPHHRSQSVQPLSPIAASNEEGRYSLGVNDNDDEGDKRHDSYHSFLAGHKVPQHTLPDVQKERKLDTKQQSDAPPFKSFRSVAKAAFSRSSSAQRMPHIGTLAEPQSKSSDRPSRGLTTKGSHQRNMSKPERILGDYVPPAPPISYSERSSRTSDHSSSHSSDDCSMLDEFSNITTPTASRPQSQKDDVVPEQEAQNDSRTTSFQLELKSHEAGKEDRSGTPNSIGLDAHFHVRPLLETSSTLEPPKSAPHKVADQSNAIEVSQKATIEIGLERHRSISRSYSTPDLQDLSFLPPLKHQPLARPSKGKEKETEVTKTPKPQLAPITIHKPEDRSLVQAPVSTKTAPPVKAGSSEYLQNARLNVLRSGPPQIAKVGRTPNLHAPTVPGQAPVPGVEPIAKMFVVCCSCHYFHDMPSKIYECMANPDNIVEDKDLGVSGHITTMVRCPWCSHGMSTQCCGGYAAVVYMQEKLH
ncbi:hypothetical protein PVAG01_06017 [Phlyctema vagabunda]|uniref:Uncharacterized protein n=1 Tax=Phlyctema vagabunda TaxID=108571 RepID=A0ABR4PEV6_9HELO